MIDFTQPLVSESGLPIELSELHHKPGSFLKPYNGKDYVLVDPDWQATMVQYFYVSTKGVIATTSVRKKFGLISNEGLLVIEDWRL